MKSISPQANFPEIEARVGEFWERNSIFRRSLEIREGSPRLHFYDGPPFATGTPHYGHLLQGTLKDILPRYHTMKGWHVERRFGWDTHGLPIEMIVEKELGLNGRLDILDYGIDKYNEACRSQVLRYVEEWRKVTGMLGRWVDFDNDYKTMTPEFMESVWWVFKQLWDQGRIYLGSRVMPYSWRLSTPLSNFEAGSNYKDIQDPAITIRLPLVEKDGVSLLIWTTTPWTLPANLAVCVGPDIDYVEVEREGERVILAEARLEAYFGKGESYSIHTRYKGAELVGLHYSPPFDYFREVEGDPFRVTEDTYVTTKDGTGLVHLAPAFGEDDHRICRRMGLPIVDPINNDGTFEEPASDLVGMNFKDADKVVIKHLKEKGRLYKQETLVHSYPFCDRSDTPLMYKALDAWYVRVEDIRERMVEHNEGVHWVPESIGQGRFANWLKEARDWNISRNRFWGNPLPIWRCSGCGSMECVGSRAELEARSGQEVPDLHKHFVDHLTWSCASCQGEMRRVPEVLDCWFESGSMPCAQLHYPFENKEAFNHLFPAHFIAEAVDQTRGWFYTLMVLSTLLFDQSPFKNVVCTGHILAEDGRKMSKRLKNYPDPAELILRYGADALRLFMINSPVVRGDNLRFSESGVRDVVRTVILPLWNAYSFFTTYAVLDEYTPSKELTDSPNILDRWILARFQVLLQKVEAEMEEYRLYNVVPVLLDFLEELTNWYIRRSRRRFWSSDKSDKQYGYNTLYFILDGFCRALAPFIPFVTEEIYSNLRTLRDDSRESIHLCDYPQVDFNLMDNELVESMALIRTAVDLGRTLRATENIRVRQPLQSLTVVTRNPKAAEILTTHGAHLKEELNVREILFSNDEEGLVEITVKPNFPLLGKRFGKRMNEVTKHLAALSRSEIERLEEGGEIEVLGESVASHEVQVLRKALSDRRLETAKGITVYYDTTLTPALIAEGRAREFVNRVQKMRKDADFQVSDRIVVRYFCSENAKGEILQYGGYVQEETLCDELLFTPREGVSGELSEEHDLDGEAAVIAVARIGA